MERCLCIGRTGDCIWWCAIKGGDSWSHLFLCGFHLCYNALKPRQEALKFVDFLVNIVCVLLASLIPILKI
jgi:hypothetical protein